MFVNKKFVNVGLITKITKILCHENLELYGIHFHLNRFTIEINELYIEFKCTLPACAAHGVMEKLKSSIIQRMNPEVQK